MNMFKQKSLATVTLFGLLFLLTLIGCTVQKADSAGQINGSYIKRQDFMNSFRGHFTGFVLEKDRTPTETEKRDMYNKTWRDITIHVILKDYFKKYEIQVTQQEVIDTLLNNIPQSVMKAPMFQLDGEFNKSRFVSELISADSQKLDWLKKYYYEYYIPIAKLKLELQKKSLISNSELKRVDKILNSSADIEWAVFNPIMTKVTVSQSEIENYYHGHAEDFQIKPYVSFGWVAVPVVLKDNDYSKAKGKIDSLYFEITNGASFVSLVEEFSQSYTAKSGGSMGFIKNEELPKAVSDAIANLSKGSYTRPVKLTNAWAIYQLEERTKNLVKLSELVIKIAPGEATKNAFKEDAIQLRDLAMQIGLDTAAGEMDLSYKLSGTVSKDSLWLKDSDLSAVLIDRAYTQKAGAILEPIYSDVMRAWILAAIVDVQPYQYRPLMEVSDVINALLKENKQKAKTMEDARIWEQLRRTNHLDINANQTLPESMIKTPALFVSGTVLSYPVRSIFLKIITDYQQSKPQSPYQIGDKILLPIVSNVKAVNPPIFSHHDVRKYYFDYLDPNWFDNWLDSEIKKANVKIWGTYP